MAMIARFLRDTINPYRFWLLIRKELLLNLRTILIAIAAVAGFALLVSIASAASGEIDPEPVSSPLVFYGLDCQSEIHLVKTLDRRIRISY